MVQTRKTKTRPKRPSKAAAPRLTSAKAAAPRLTSVVNRLPRGASRQLILDFLESQGGEIADKSGRATTILHEKSHYPGSMGGLAALLQSMEAEGAIVRSVSGRRCSRIALANMPAPEGAKDVEPDPDPIGRTGLVGLGSMERIDVPQVDPRYDELAWALLRTCSEILGKQDTSTTEMKTRLTLAAEYLDEAKRRISSLEKQLAEEKSLRDDELRAVKDENKGLRRRLHLAEENNSVLVKQLQRRQPQGTDGYKALDKMIRERPSQRG